MDTKNPLAFYMRQPKIYIRLPSNGNYWTEGSLEISETGDYPVYSMTAKDELSLKIPDALMNGQAVVDVIQHCMPNIKNAWACPEIDLDIILIAIRLATYGEMMTTPVKIGDVEVEYQVDLRVLMDTLQNQIGWRPVISVSDDLTIFVRPLDYKRMTQSAIQAFETEKIMQVVNNDNLSEEQKLSLFKDSFSKMTAATLGNIVNSIEKIESIHGSTDNLEHISDFVNNIDKEIYSQIENHLIKLKEQNSIKPLKVAVTAEMREQGISGDSIDVPITFDPATFFV